ncbi:MAG: PEGA domain-containing protein, partial [Spirochaetota bacterium]
ALPAAARMIQTGDAELMVSLAAGAGVSAGASAGADIYVNGSPVGKAPGLIQRLPAGVPLVVEARSGFDAAKVELTLKPRELKEVSLKLERMKGNLFVEANEKNVEVWLDGQKVGPLGTGLFRDLPAGEHSLELKGQDLYHQSRITIPGNETARLAAVVVGIGSIQVEAPDSITVSLSGPGGLARSQRGAGTVSALPEGSYRLTATGSGFEQVSTTLNVRKGGTARWTPYTVGTLQITVAATGARLSVNGQTPGEVPASLALAPGRYSLAFSAPGYHETIETVNVIAGRTLNINPSLKELARASLEIDKAPFGVRLVINNSPVTSPVESAATAKTLLVKDIPAGIPVNLEAQVAFATQLDASLARMDLRFEEGVTLRMELPSGQFSVPWLPEKSVLYFTPGGRNPGGQGTVAVPMSQAGLTWESPILVAGLYEVRMLSPYRYSGMVTIQNGKVIELPGFRETMQTALGNDIVAQQKRIKARSTRTRFGWVSLATGLVGSGAAAAAYYLGGQAWDSYQNAQATQDALGAKTPAELWGTVLPSAAAAGGLGLGLAPILWAGGPDPKALERSIAASEESLKRLRGE